MANIVFIEMTDTFKEDNSGERSILQAQIQDNIQLQTHSNLSAPSGMIPAGIGRILSLMKTFQAISGKRGSITTASDYLDVPVWSGTDPIKLDLKLSFYTETDPYADVWYPIMSLASLMMISPAPGGGGGFLLPGINLGNLSQALKGNKKPTTDEGKVAAAAAQQTLNNLVNNKTAKLIDVFIPGVIYLHNALAEKVSPVFSNEITESGFPLWGEVTMTINSVQPANTLMFQNFTKGKVSFDTGETGSLAIDEGSSKFRWAVKTASFL